MLPDGRGTALSVMSGKGYILYIGFFQPMNLPNVPLRAVPAPGRELAGRALHGAAAAAPGQGLLLLDLGGAIFFSAFLNKALKWEVDPIVFIYCINIHFNSFQRLTHFSSSF